MSGPAPRYADLDPKRIERLYRLGLSQAQVGEKMGVSQNTICRAMRYFGIQARPRGWAARWAQPETDSVCSPGRCPHWGACLDWPVDEPCRELQESRHGP